MSEVQQPEPSIPSNLNIQIRGFEEAIAQRLGYRVRAVVEQLSRYLPLENLDGITIGYDYQEALACVDRGFPVTNPVAKPTEDPDHGIGIAMALPVSRDGVLKTHVVFGPMIATLLDEEENQNGIRMALRTISHELGHAVDHEYKYRAFGNIATMKVDALVGDSLEQYLWGLSHHAWDEYFANRIATNFFRRGEDEEELFLTVHQSFRKKIADARFQYQIGQINLEELLAELEHHLYLALLATAYLFGMNDADDEAARPRAAPEATLLLEADEDLMRFHTVLLKLWDKRSKWESYLEFLELNRPMIELLHSLDFYPSLLENGALYMDVP